MVQDNPFYNSSKNNLNDKSSVGISKKKINLSGLGAQRGRPNIIDRVLAFIIDMAFLLPLSSLVLFSFRREIETFLKTPEAKIDLILSLGVYGFYLFLFLSLTLALFVSVLGYTPGQKVMRLKVVDNESQDRPTLLQAWLYSSLLLLSLLFLGWPLFQGLIHSKRKFFHDLGSDIEVLTLKEPSILTQSKIDTQMVKSFYIVTSSLLLSFFVLMTSFIFSQSSKRKVTQLSQVKPHCDNLLDGNHIYDQMISSYLMGLVDEACVLSVQEEAFASTEELLDWAYLLKAIVYKEETELVLQYEKHLCRLETTSEACYLWGLYKDKKFPNSKPHEKLTLTEKILTLESYKFWGHGAQAKLWFSLLPQDEIFSKNKASIDQLVLMENHSNDNLLVKTHWEAIKNFLTEEESYQFIQLGCDQELKKSCLKKDTYFCQQFITESKKYFIENDPKEDELVRLSHARACAQSDDKMSFPSVKWKNPINKEVSHLFQEWDALTLEKRSQVLSSIFKRVKTPELDFSIYRLLNFMETKIKQDQELKKTYYTVIPNLFLNLWTQIKNQTNSESVLAGRSLWDDNAKGVEGMGDSQNLTPLTVLEESHTTGSSQFTNRVPASLNSKGGEKKEVNQKRIHKFEKKSFDGNLIDEN